MFPRVLGGVAVGLALLPLVAWSQPQADTSPPSPGIVLDGLGGPDRERDTQDYTNILQADWGQSPRFSDPESGISGYARAIGTRPCGTEVRVFEPRELLLSETLYDLNLTRGQRYYVTIRATNGAGLSTYVSSDGVLVLLEDGSTGDAPAALPGGVCTPDSGTADAGTDGGSPGTPSDGGTFTDGGSSQDGGMGTTDDPGPLESPLGWGCAAGGPGGVALMVLSVLGLGALRRRPRR
ncbi:hypothetical protein F0U60_26730 [Archangium minus]|uniref:Fibronectin type-III domain-containing protein n=1 Tax=Archangium minus TaxID=83450 RepID=A0ABY9WVH6_9BACT|nr:hypothetical protein F0U60_26730 [Archangium minus]